MTEELEKILRRDRSPLAENPFAKSDAQMTPIERMSANAPPLDSEIQKHLTNFSLITHGFGGPAMVAVLNAFRLYLSSMRSNYDKILNGSTNPTSNQGHEMMNSATSSSSSNNTQKSNLNSYSSSIGRSNSNSYFNPLIPSSSSNRTQNNPASIELTSLKVESKD